MVQNLTYREELQTKDRKASRVALFPKFMATVFTQSGTRSCLALFCICFYFEPETSKDSLYVLLNRALFLGRVTSSLYITSYSI